MNVGEQNRIDIEGKLNRPVKFDSSSTKTIAGWFVCLFFQLLITVK